MTLIEELKRIIEDWRDYQSFTGDPQYDLGRELSRAACADELEELLENVTGDAI